MELELVTVGTELLLGLTVDTNAAEISRALASVGARVVRRSTVADDGAAIRHAVRDGLSRTGFVIVTGGLGPTRDDVTKKAVAALFDAPLELDQAYLERLRERFASLGRGVLPPSNRSQAEFPRGAVVLTNMRGTAPGLWLEGAPGTAVLLPGVPHEMRALLMEEVVPRLERHARRVENAVVIRSRTLRTTGITESALASAIDTADAVVSPVTLAYLPGIAGVDLRLTCWDLPAAEADAALERAVQALHPHLGNRLYGEGDADLAGVVLERLRARRFRLAIAESCTGGLIAARITGVAGSSAVLAGGVVCYSNESKVRDVAVPPAVIERHGAVSEEVARAMAAGVVNRFGTDAGIGVTGIAGPTGGTPDKPVGTVWLAARVGDRERVVCRRFLGDRDQIRRRAAQSALDLVRLLLDSSIG